MKKRLLLLFLFCCLLPACGCAVAVTANVQMPQTHAVAGAVQPLSAGTARTAEAVTDVVIEGDTDDVGGGAASADAPAAASLPVATALATDASQSPATLTMLPAETPAAPADPTPTAEPTAAPTPEATAKPTPKPTPSYVVEEIMPEAGYVYAKSVNLRESPNTECDVIAEYERGQELTITGKTGDWYRVEVDEICGFMLQEYGKVGTPETEKTPEPTPKPTPKPT
ncbi:MAG: SH3 domain-containing protein, partial [Clostridia bacterium]|nr:SH3 domain-containing protein [Clostridia bacterium]